jgi:hypothetical protein
MFTPGQGVAEILRCAQDDTSYMIELKKLAPFLSVVAGPLTGRKAS